MPDTSGLDTTCETRVSPRLQELKKAKQAVCTVLPVTQCLKQGIRMSPVPQVGSNFFHSSVTLRLVGIRGQKRSHSLELR